MSAKLRWVGVICLVIASLAVHGTEAESEGQETGSEMTTVQLVLLFRGPNQTPMGEREIQSHQEAHLDYLDGLLEQGSCERIRGCESVGSGPRSTHGRFPTGCWGSR
jgi:hypothetical protein